MIEVDIIQLIDVACSGTYGKIIAGPHHLSFDLDPCTDRSVFVFPLITADGVASKIIKSLIPRDSVPVLAVVKAISWISTNALSSSLQVWDANIYITINF